MLDDQQEDNSNRQNSGSKIPSIEQRYFRDISLVSDPVVFSEKSKRKTLESATFPNFGSDEENENLRRNIFPLRYIQVFSSVQSLKSRYSNQFSHLNPVIQFSLKITCEGSFLGIFFRT